MKVLEMNCPHSYFYTVVLVRDYQTISRWCRRHDYYCDQEYEECPERAGEVFTTDIPGTDAVVALITAFREKEKLVLSKKWPLLTRELPRGYLDSSGNIEGWSFVLLQCWSPAHLFIAEVISGRCIPTWVDPPAGLEDVAAAYREVGSIMMAEVPGAGGYVVAIVPYPLVKILRERDLVMAPRPLAGLPPVDMGRISDGYEMAMVHTGSELHFALCHQAAESTGVAVYSTEDLKYVLATAPEGYLRDLKKWTHENDTASLVLISKEQKRTDEVNDTQKEEEDYVESHE